MVRPALQLYSVRDAQQPISELLHRIGAAGYDGVEFAKVPTADYEALSSALSDAGLEVVGIHLRLLELRDKREAIIDTCHELGCSDLVIAHVSPSHFRTRSRVDALANHITAQAATLADAGISLHYHNQCFEFQSVDTNAVVDHAAAVCNPSPLENSDSSVDQGSLQQYQRMAGTAGERLLDTLGSPPPADSFAETGFAHFLDATDANTVKIEPDLGNVRAAGFDPADLTDATADRSTLVHIKDEFVMSPGPYPKEKSAPLGAGDVDVEAAIAMAESTDANWVVLENDDPTDPLAPIENGRDAFESAPI